MTRGILIGLAIGVPLGAALLWAALAYIAGAAAFHS